MLTKQNKALLRKAGHTIEHPYLLGKGEVDANFLAQLDAALKAKELIKVKLLSNCATSIQDVANIICLNLHAEIVDIIGHTALVYRESEKRIYLK